MKISSFQFSGRELLSTTQLAADAVRDRGMDRRPDLMFVFYSSINEIVDSRELLLENFPDVRIIASSSEHGIISNNQNFYNMEQAVGVMAFYDPDGAYGTASGYLQEENLTESVQQIIQDALQDCNREGELPRLVWFYAANSDQEKIIDVLEEYFGSSVPIFGGVPGKVGDQKVCYDQNNIFFNGHYLMLVLLYPSCEIKTGFGSLYQSTKFTGMITRVEDDRVIEIDYKPAYQVYSGWLNSIVPREMFEDQSVYMDELLLLHPLGIQIGVAGIEQNYQVFQIMETVDDQELVTTNHFKFGDRITLLSPNKDNSLDREFQSQLMLNDIYFDNSKIYGVLSAVCAGYRNQLVPKNLKFLEKVTMPLMGLVSSGEHGRFTNGTNHESNLMIESVIFYERH